MQYCSTHTSILFLPIRSVFKANKMIFYIILFTVIHVQVSDSVDVVYANPISRLIRINDNDCTYLYECTCMCRKYESEYRLPSEANQFYHKLSTDECCRNKVVCFDEPQITELELKILCSYADDKKERLTDRERQRTPVNHPKTFEPPNLSTESEPQERDDLRYVKKVLFIGLVITPVPFTIFIFLVRSCFQNRNDASGNTNDTRNVNIDRQSHLIPLNSDFDLNNTDSDTFFYSDTCPPYEAPPTYDEAIKSVCLISNTHRIPEYKTQSKSQPVAEHTREHTIISIEEEREEDIF